MKVTKCRIKVVRRAKVLIAFSIKQEGIVQGWADFFNCGPNLKTIFHFWRDYSKYSDEKVTIFAKLKKFGSFDAFIDRFRPNFLL